MITIHLIKHQSIASKSLQRFKKRRRFENTWIYLFDETSFANPISAEKENKKHEDTENMYQLHLINHSIQNQNHFKGLQKGGNLSKTREWSFTDDTSFANPASSENKKKLDEDTINHAYTSSSQSSNTALNH